MYMSLNCRPKSIVVKMFLSVCLKKTKKKRKKYAQKKPQKNATKKRQLKITTKKYNKKRRGDKKEWVKGEEEPTDKYLSSVLSESFKGCYESSFRKKQQVFVRFGFIDFLDLFCSCRYELVGLLLKRPFCNTL